MWVNSVRIANDRVPFIGVPFIEVLLIGVQMIGVQMIGVLLIRGTNDSGTNDWGTNERDRYSVYSLKLEIFNLFIRYFLRFFP